MKFGFVTVLVFACLAGVAVAQDCTDVRPGFGFFSPSCGYRKERGECKDLVAQGYCLETCGGCKQEPEPISSAPSAVAEKDSEVEEAAAPTSERETMSTEEKKKQEELYQEQLLDEVSMIEKGDGKDVEVLPELVMPVDETATQLAPVAETQPKLPIKCSSTVLKDLKNDLNLTTAYKAALALNLTTVFERNDITYTIFVPVNAAWEAGAESLGLTEEELFEKPAVLAKILFTGIIPDMILDEDALDLTETMQSQSGETLSFAYNPTDDVYTVSVAPDSVATIVAAEKYVGCNYMMHTIDTLLA